MTKKIGRPKLKEPTRKINLRLPVPFADWIEKNLERIAKMFKAERGDS